MTIAVDIPSRVRQATTATRSIAVFAAAYRAAREYVVAVAALSEGLLWRDKETKAEISK